MGKGWGEEGGRKRKNKGEEGKNLENGLPTLLTQMFMFSFLLLAYAISPPTSFIHFLTSSVPPQLPLLTNSSILWRFVAASCTSPAACFLFPLQAPSPSPFLPLFLCILKWNIRACTAYTQTHSCLALSSDGHSNQLAQHAEMLM